MQEMLGSCEAQNGTNIDDLLQAGGSEHKIAWQDVKTNPYSRRWLGSYPGGNKWKLQDKKKES